MANTIKIKQIDQTQLAAFVNDLIDGTGATYTASRAVVTDASGDITTSSVTSTELGYLSGVTSAIQTQLSGKLTSTLTSAYVFVGNGSNVATGVAISGDISISNAGVVSIATGVIVNADINTSAAIALSKLAATTASRALVSDGSGFISASSVTSTELGYVSGVTSAIQTQFNNLGSTYLPLAGGTMTGALTLDAASLLKFGGATSGEPALKRSSTELQVRLANDSGYATSAAGCFTSHGSIADPSGGGYWMLRHRNSDGGAYWGFSQKHGGTGDIQVWISGVPKSTLGAHMIVADTGGGFSWSWGPGAFAANLAIIRDTTDVVAIYGTTNAALRLYGAYTNESNYVRASLAATSTTVTLAAETAGTGEDNVYVNLRATGTGAVTVGNGSDSFSFYIHDGNSNCIAIRENGGLSYFGTVIERDLVLLRNSTRAATLTANGFLLGNASDAGISRNDSGIVEVNNGTPGTFRDLKLRTLISTNAGSNAKLVDFTSPDWAIRDGTGGNGGIYISNPSFTAMAAFQAGGIGISHGTSLWWAAYPNSQSSNTGICRSSNGVVQVNTGTVNAFGDLQIRTLEGFYAYTNGSNYQGFKLTSGANSVTLSAETAGTGADNIDVSITPTGTGKTILGGNVAVGSTSAANQISIYTSSNLSDSSTSGISITNNDSTGYANTIWYNDSNDIGQFLLTGSAGSISGTTIMARQAVFTSVGATNGLHFYTDTGPIYFTPGGGTTVRMIQLTNGNVGIATTSPSNILSFGGNSARIIWMERHTTSDTAGNNLTVQAGGATSGATNKAGGYLDLVGGISTGTGEGGVRIKGYVAGSSGTSDNSASTMIEVLSNKIGFFGVTPVIRQTTGIAAATFVANTSAIADDTATWGGYTAGQIVTALKNVGILT